MSSVDEKMLMGYINNKNVNSFSSQDFNNNANHQISFNAYPVVNNDNNAISDSNISTTTTTTKISSLNLNYPLPQSPIWNTDSDWDTSLELAKVFKIS